MTPLCPSDEFARHPPRHGTLKRLTTKVHEAGGTLALLWLLVALPVLLSAALVLPTARACSIGPHRPVLGGTSDVAMLVKHGMSCAVFIKTGDAEIDRLDIVSRPQQGAVTQRGRTGLVYRATRQNGEDSFAFRLHGKSRDRAIDATVRVTVAIR
jgi:hypothetical protein